MFLKRSQTASNVMLTKQQMFLTNSMINMKHVAMATFAPLHYQHPFEARYVILKACKKTTGNVDSFYFKSLCYNIHIKLLGIQNLFLSMYKVKKYINTM